MSTNTDTLTPVVNLVIDGVMDGIKAVENGKNVLADAPLLTQLVSDVMAAGGSFAGVPAALKSLTADDVEALVADVVTKLSLPNAHAQAVVNAALQAAAKVGELILVLATPAPAAPAAAAPAAS